MVVVKLRNLATMFMSLFCIHSSRDNVGLIRSVHGSLYIKK